MREPTGQTRLLASAPVFFGSWTFGIWSLYQLSQQDAAWPAVVIAGVLVAAVAKADEQKRAWDAWQMEWDALGGARPPRQRRLPVLHLLVALPLLAVLASLLIDVGTHGGNRAVIGVLMILGGPLLLLAGIVRLWRWARSRRRSQAARTMPVRVCIHRAIVPVPSLDAAYSALPPYCQQLLGRQP